MCGSTVGGRAPKACVPGSATCRTRGLRQPSCAPSGRLGRRRPAGKPTGSQGPRPRPPERSSARARRAVALGAAARSTAATQALPGRGCVPRPAPRVDNCIRSLALWRSHDGGLLPLPSVRNGAPLPSVRSGSGARGGNAASARPGTRQQPHASPSRSRAASSGQGGAAARRSCARSTDQTALDTTDAPNTWASARKM